MIQQRPTAIGKPLVYMPILLEHACLSKMGIKQSIDAIDKLTYDEFVGASLALLLKLKLKQIIDR
ncbi:hypothetical protein L2729_18390 [Shewanella gelidimarina]|uniref:hypothetical protein n=1 Tax=Shewanella gelidimarina TaxID=56813 RepID=UPI00200E0192|nr:hypothetical protein [Shewanella gelidimarina]MCL1059941.1 hypothetical protein [Shewanella gelidimarina]